MPRLFAPEGVTSYSHNGHAFDIEKDGTVDVSDVVAEALKPFGFTAGPAAPSEFVRVKRADLLAALDKIGAAANPNMDADKLAGVLSAAVAIKEKKPEKAPEKPAADKGKTS